HPAGGAEGLAHQHAVLPGQRLALFLPEPLAAPPRADGVLLATQGLAGGLDLVRRLDDEQVRPNRELAADVERADVPLALAAGDLDDRLLDDLAPQGEEALLERDADHHDVRVQPGVEDALAEVADVDADVLPRPGVLA